MKEKDIYDPYTDVAKDALDKEVCKNACEEIPSKFKKLIKGMDIRSWPDKPKTYEELYLMGATGDNHSTIFTFLGKRVGLTCRDGQFSIQLDHPMADFWSTIFKPIWAKQNEGKCMTCNGTGWDGIGYTYTCIDCGGTGKPKKNKETK